MKCIQWLAACLALVVGAGSASAEYLLIQINLSKHSLPTGAALGGAGMTGGMPGGPGGMPGGMMGGGVGFGGGVGMRGMMPGGMPGGGVGFGGGLGMRGMPGGPGGMPGGIMGGPGGMPGGAAGLMGGAGGPQAGFIGIQPEPAKTEKSRLRFPPQYRHRQVAWANKTNDKDKPATPKANTPMGTPMPGLPMGAGGGPMGNSADADEPELWVSAYIELKPVDKKNLIRVFGKHAEMIEIAHKWGHHHFIPLALQGSMLNIVPYGQKSFDKQFEADFNKNVKAKNLEGLLYQASWALGHGLHKQFHQALEEAAKLDAKHPVVQNVARLEQAFKAKPPTALEPGQEELQKELERAGYRPMPSKSGRYTLLVNVPPSHPGASDDIKRRLARLDETFETFYYWFALQKDLSQPPLPRTQLLAVLVASPQDFVNRHVGWGSPPMVADGFTPRQENVMFLSGQPTDEPYVMLEKHLSTALKVLNADRTEVLTGAIWKRKDILRSPQLTMPLAALQTALVVEKALEEESERATLTHEGTRQLLIASGLFPRHVAVPEWVLEGLASYFETPVGAVYPGVGLPSWSNLIAFKQLRAAGKLGKEADVLTNVVTDHYFHEAQKTNLDWLSDKDNEELGEKAQQDAETARCTAWALVYYLARMNKLDTLFRYGQELNGLPRDLDLNDRALQGCFARAFGVSDAKNAQKLDPARLQTEWAGPWFDEMTRINLEVPLVESEVMSFLTDRANKHKETPRRPSSPSSGPTGTPPPPPPPMLGGS